jgi:CHAD domain-containing protein
MPTKTPVRESRRAVMLERLDRINADKLGRRLGSVTAALELATDEPWRKALAARLVTRSRRLIAAMDEAGQMYSPEKLHQVRIASKKLRYGLELAADSGVKAAAPCVRTMKRAQDMLGKLHDLQVLQTYVAEVQARGPSKSHAALEQLALHIEEQCRHLHGRYVALAPAVRDIALAVRKTIAPGLAQAPKRRRPLKMVLPRAADARVADGTR